jgi:glycine cleavage system aminomethyltransferase T
MESRFVNLERECPHRRTTPFELGLQWMIDFTHGFAARDALLGRWDSEATRLPVCFTAPRDTPAHPGVEVLLDGQVVGSVTHAVWSPAVGHVVGVAHLDRDVAVPGLPLSTRGEGGATPITTCSGPFLVPTSVAGLRR